MLQSLAIRNYTLINQIEIDFNNGFSIITGETGSGKSILLGALGLVLGQRPETNILKDKDLKCVVEAHFNISKYHLQKFFADAEMEYEEETILRREILPNGKTRAFVNDSPVSVKLLKELGLRLIDIHSQNQNLSLGDSEYQMGIVDTYAQHASLLNDYQVQFENYQHIKRELYRKEQIALKEKSDLDYYQFQLEQLLDANLVDGEQVEMESELETLNHAEEIKTNLFKASNLLSEGEVAIISLLKEARSAIGQVQNVFSDGENFYERFESSCIELQDLASELERSYESMEFDPSRISFLNERLDTIYSFQQKHRVESVEELIKIREDLDQKVQDISSSDDLIEELKEQLQKQELNLVKVSEKLSKSRRSVIPDIEKALESQLIQLGMPHAKINFEQSIAEEFQYLGKDLIRILFSANKNGQLEEISKVASGGEMSRLMLSIKYLISASTALPSIVFDEIDTGVSGEIADKMGVVMRDMAENIQVISITHLPQIASKGNYHYKVYKADDELETYSNIVLLDSESRIEELAKMLSGADMTQAAMENAKVLLYR
ncbi:DNA repair protein RecN [Ancylomarina euxinus]|uniref:DNA repair protein RecN n=1 Tax=Ancylomarina euxinus TaxID=2283627 RepID=A0A425Y0C5_9BACT|nr:DNA repair protein RecN [Ancylomarina euxinus]MCZ4695278.1 DNA repair protein RecN [Ancylomarina euxinus]MUP15475.1 DNA repair protein RecN [Ancylomarina euxinus]RRG21184.1 DNA repair protein RecN [Ancylomarina euxinus]